MDAAPGGIINLDKPAGPSSARLVARVKRLLPRGTRVGHAGTLDPFATGVLLILVGKATRSCERLMDGAKGYDAEVRLGAQSATDDPEGPVTAVEGIGEPPTRAAVEAALGGFVGTILQRPPAFSAMKVGGRRAYDLARGGSEVVLAPRPVRVEALSLLDYEWPVARLRVACGRGTYVRAIARDLGAALGVGGYLTALRRTRVGPFTDADAVPPERLEREGVAAFLRPVPE